MSTIGTLGTIPLTICKRNEELEPDIDEVAYHIEVSHLLTFCKEKNESKSIRAFGNCFLLYISQTLGPLHQAQLILWSHQVDIISLKILNITMGQLILVRGHGPQAQINTNIESEVREQKPI